MLKDEPLEPQEGNGTKELRLADFKYKEFICGEEALKISPNEPYCLRRPIRRGHFNVSQHYSMQQVQCILRLLMLNSLINVKFSS